MPDTLQRYLTIEYAKAVRFYDTRAASSKLWYRGLSIYLISAAAILTPVVTLAPNSFCWRLLAAVLSTSIIVVTGLLAHLKSHENWLSYRASWDALERERRHYETRTGNYAHSQDPGGSIRRTHRSNHGQRGVPTSTHGIRKSTNSRRLMKASDNADSLEISGLSGFPNAILGPFGVFRG